MSFTTANRTWHCNGIGEWESDPFIIRHDHDGFYVTNSGRNLLDGEPRHLNVLAAMLHAERHADMTGMIDVETVDPRGKLRDLAVERVEWSTGGKDHEADYDERHRLLCASLVAGAAGVPTVWGCACDPEPSDDGSTSEYLRTAPPESYLGNLVVTDLVARARHQILYGHVTSASALIALSRLVSREIETTVGELLGERTIYDAEVYLNDVYAATVADPADQLRALRRHIDEALDKLRDARAESDAGYQRAAADHAKSLVSSYGGKTVAYDVAIGIVGKIATAP